jgi:hypothetical protein
MEGRFRRASLNGAAAHYCAARGFLGAPRASHIRSNAARLKVDSNGAGARDRRVPRGKRCRRRGWRNCPRSHFWCGSGDWDCRPGSTARADTVENILARDIFRRHVILGAKDASRAGCNLDGLMGHMWKSDVEVAPRAQPAATSEDLVDIVRHTSPIR